jgi:hypothetical protein
VTWICNGCAVAGGGTDFGIILFVLSMVIATTVIAAMLLYAGLGDHRHGPFMFVEDRDLNEATYRCVTCGEIVTAAEGYYPLSSMR